MKHQHDHCQHDLKYCEKCDVVYCTKCDKEWGIWNYVYNYPSVTYQPYITNSNTGTITTGHTHEG